MRVLSSGFRGVEPFRNKFYAFYSKRGNRKNLGTYETAEQAASEVDAVTVRRRGILEAYALLNLPTEEHSRLYAEALRRKEEVAAQLAVVEEAELRAKEIPEDMYPELLKRFSEGKTIVEIARDTRFHPEKVKELIRRLLEKQRLSIGLVGAVPGLLDEDTLADHIESSVKNGESLRRVSDRIGISRTALMRFLKRKET